MVPVRVIAEELGAIVQWDAQERAATIKSADKTFSVPLLKPLPDNMGQALIIEWFMMAPLHYIAENLGAKVVWDAADNKVTIIV